MFSLGDLYEFPARQLSSHMAPFIELIDLISTNVLPCSVASPAFMCLPSGTEATLQEVVPAKLPQLGTKRAILPSDSFLRIPDCDHLASHYRSSMQSCYAF